VPRGVAAAMNALQCDWLESLPAVAALRPEWDGPYGVCTQASPFQSSAWLLPWARHFAPDRFHAIALRKRGALVTLVPFFVWQQQLLLAGTGHTDYCDGLFADGAGCEQALAALTDCATELGCRRIDLQQLRESSALLKAAAPAPWRSEVTPGVTCPVTLLRSGEGPLGVSAKWQRNVAAALRNLTRQPGFGVELTSTSLFEGANAVLADLHSARWRARGQGGVLADPLLRDFLASVLPELSAAGALRLHTLHVRGRVIAAVLCLHGHAMTCYYISGFDPEWSRYSPGSVTLAAAMRHAATEARELHFLRGSEPYKYRLGARDRPTWRRVLTRTPQDG